MNTKYNGGKKDAPLEFVMAFRKLCKFLAEPVTVDGVDHPVVLKFPPLIYDIYATCLAQLSGEHFEFASILGDGKRDMFQVDGAEDFDKYRRGKIAELTCKIAASADGVLATFLGKITCIQLSNRLVEP